MQKKLLLNSAAALSFSTKSPSDSIIPAAEAFDVVGIAPPMEHSDFYYLNGLAGARGGKTAMAASILSEMIGFKVIEADYIPSNRMAIVNPYLFSKRGAKSPGITVKEYD